MRVIVVKLFTKANTLDQSKFAYTIQLVVKELKIYKKAM